MTALHMLFPGVYSVSLSDGTEKLATQNLTPNRTVYREKTVDAGGRQYRLWDPYRSKLAAAVCKGLKTMPITPDSRVLYLGAASGTTASHISDIIGTNGTVYCVEFAQRSMRELLAGPCAHRGNMVPISADARMPDGYRMLVAPVDAIYCDIAQPEQAKILADNADMFLKGEGWILLAVKARSIDVAEQPSSVFRREVDVLKKRGFKPTQTVDLQPFDKAHCMVAARWR
ncbi:MAG: fibrillarin-like rRNA/tRNA 2'-O-methyltransferase [Candidatus Bathyarchaeia archaeon]